MAAHKFLRAAIVSSLCLGLAAADDCSGTTTISGSSDATSLAKACKTYSGTIAVATGTSDDLDLAEIEGSTISVSNTKITSLDGGASNGVLQDVKVSSNSDLSDITIEGTHASNITIGENSDDVSITFPHLKEAVDIEIADAAKLDLSALESLPRGALHIYGGSLEKLDLAEFREVMGGLILEDMPKLTDLSAPEFTRIMDAGSLTISGTGLTKLSLPKLQLVYDALWLEGDFESVDLPLLTSIGGDIYMKGAKSFDCDAFSTQFKDLAQDGHSFKCVAGDDDDDSDDAAKPTASSSFDDGAAASTAAASASGTAKASSTAKASGSSASASASGTAAAASGSATPGASGAPGSSGASTFGMGMGMVGGVVGLITFCLF
ncbi:putative gpi-anchored cell wall organization protein ecm33 [Diplodia seriata]|uniref:Putative gpi-anchored cell wall organization protein ecm33 n=1 Tax=Diplodia seriata TaxID=420778 RepID=A0A0G2HF94_9PEZI|nr:putative gpi-anchored cell wall organization protein ecm33 [Diplodia seriata]